MNKEKIGAGDYSWEGCTLKLRNIVNLPVLLADTAEKLGWIEKTIIGDDYKVLYLVVISDAGQAGLIFYDDFEIGEDAVVINDLASIKSYAHGEELSIYDKKLGDLVFDKQGRELGVVSDFIINRDEKEIWGVEVSSGIVKDMLDGRSEIPLAQLSWASPVTAVYDQEGNE